MPHFPKKEFQSAAELASFANQVGILYFHVYEDQPDDAMLKEFQDLRPYEALVLMPRRTNDAAIRDLYRAWRLPYCGAWTSGWLMDYAFSAEEIRTLIEYSRNWYLAPRKAL